MKIRTLLLLVAALALVAVPAFAQDMATHTVNFNGIGFQFPASLAANVSVQTFAGDAPEMEQPGGPEVAHTEFALYNNAITDLADVPMMDVVGSVRVYNAANFAGYEMATAQLQNLQALLAERPDLTVRMVVAEDNSLDLPFMPTFPGSQIIRAQAHYVDTPVLSGVAYVTAYRLDVSPLTAGEFSYTFQGLSNDGQYYVSAIFPVTASAFPIEIEADFDYDAFSQGFLDYLADSIALLNQAAPGEIQPELVGFDAIIQSMTLPTTVAQPEPQPTLVAPEGPAPTEDFSGQNPSLGGLAGTWRLVQYGNVDEPTPVIEGSEITATFETSGISGNAGCNGYGGSFRFEGNTLTVSDVVSTLMACEDDAVTMQEAAYLAALGSVTNYEVGDATLRLFYPEGALVFAAFAEAATEEAVVEEAAG